MIKTENKKVLVVFGQTLPKKSRKWYKRFDEVLGPKELKEFINPGSVREACLLVNEIPKLVTANGVKISKLIDYQGYDLWWMHFDEIYYKFCLPFTQYRNLLMRLKDFEEIYLFEPPWPNLFQYFLKAHNRKCSVLKQFRLRQILPVSFGVFLQILLSIGFLPFLIIARPRLMVWTSDKFDPPHDYDFRYKFIYEELRKRKIPFVEFIRSVEPWSVILQHVWQRKRPVFYSTTIIEFIHSFTRRLRSYLPPFSSADPEEYFWFLVGIAYLRNIKGTIWSIRMIKLVLRWIGVKAAIIPSISERTVHEVLACKLLGIKTVGIMHGASSKYYDVADFMPGFDGEKTLSVDQYGVWSEWWKDYHIKNSHAYSEDQLFVSGPMRPLEKEIGEGAPHAGGPIKVLYISEWAAVPEEILPYILTLLESGDFKMYFKFRPYRDDFELWLKENQPEVYKKILKTAKILRGTMEEAIAQCDVAVGSYSTAVLEGLLQLKPSIFFWTNKWGDHFDLKAAGFNSLFAESPQELIERIKKSQEISEDDLKKLRKQFFGDPHQNGSKWIVDQIGEILKI